MLFTGGEVAMTREPRKDIRALRLLDCLSHLESIIVVHSLYAVYRLYIKGSSTRWRQHEVRRARRSLEVMHGVELKAVLKISIGVIHKMYRYTALIYIFYIYISSIYFARFPPT